MGSVADIESILSVRASRVERERARAIIASGRLVVVWENPRILVYMGEHGDHVIVDSNYCSCESFYFSMLRGAPGCYHIRALRQAPDAAKSLRRLNASLEEAWDIIYEILTTGFSTTLRKLLFTED